MDREISRGVRRLYLQTIGGCLLCCALGAALVGWAFHTSDPEWGAISLWSGLVIGDGGMLLLLIRHYGRSNDKGF